VLRSTGPFASFPEPHLERLASAAIRMVAPADAYVVRQGDRADSLFVIERGQAEVRLDQASGGLPLAALGPSECFGFVGLLNEDHRRTADVVALSPLTLWRIDEASLRRASGDVLALANSLEDLVAAVARENLLRQVAAFATLDATQRRELAERITTRTLHAGEVVFRQGEEGTECYLVQDGKIELTRSEDGTEGHVALLGRGTLFGETAALTSQPRSASAAAQDPATLLVLSTADLDRVLGMDAVVQSRVAQIMRLRHRPTCREAIELHMKDPPEGEVVAVLKDPERHRYFRLSVLGLFVWERLDGTRNVRDLALDGMRELHTFAPDAIAHLTSRLQASGFIEGLPLQPVTPAAAEQRWWLRPIELAYRGLTWMREIPGLDRIVDGVYRGGGRLVFTRPAQIVLAVLALAGPVAVIASSGRARGAIDMLGGSSGWALLLGFLIASTIHDSGHALATKHFGWEVRGGVGFFWLSPIIFINTSDIWLAPKRQRIIVTLAGPYAHLITAGLAGALALVAHGFALVLLWEFALFAFADVILNLSPLLELDGYYLVVHLTDRPNLRRRSLAFLAEDLPRAFRTPAVLKGQGFELAYGIASILFVICLTGYSILMYRLTILPWLRSTFSPTTTTAVGWTLAAIVGLATLGAIVGDIRQAVAVSRVDRRR
jgi:putative peptide zinc metalloprotease protein